SKEYFWRYNAKDVEWHTQQIINNSSNSSLVTIRQNNERGGTELFIYTPVQNSLFTQVTATLAQLGLSIVDAKIMQSKEGMTLDTYVILDQDGEQINDPYQTSRIEERLKEMLAGDYQPPEIIRGTQQRQLKLFKVPVQIYFSQEESSGLTVVEVISTDQPGLLSQIAYALGEQKVILHNARITTLGERAEDLFFISSANNQPINEEEIKEAIFQAIGEEGA
ncbi:MAG: [protein-PII] uridylyltransferase, partial [Gammaproteobacteria bacterium]|nr:[protein-PII] uridylyltransferase [Gammaproteobacteria bacterium]